MKKRGFIYISLVTLNNSEVCCLLTLLLTNYSLTKTLTYLLIYLLTYSMEKSSSWEANWFAASQGIPHVLWNPKVPHRTHKRPPPVPILSQHNPVLTHIYSTSWRSILILSCHLSLGLPSCLFPSGFPTRTLHKPHISPYVLHAPPISFFSILSPVRYWVKSTDHSAPHYVIILKCLRILSLLLLINLVLIPTCK
jgi:hypothetical protein